MDSKKALLVVSFGTSVTQTREKTIAAIERHLAAEFPDRKLYRAWTSGVIRRKLLKTEGLQIDSVAEALDRIAADGAEDLLVQPTHLLDGEENRLMIEAIRAAADRFASVKIGAPLLSTAEDLIAAADIVNEVCPDLGGDELFVWMGHGSAELLDNVYVALNFLYAREGRDNICVGTVEFDPGFAPVEEMIVRRSPRRAYLMPLMVVAGDHAINDMAGDEPDSWKSIIAASGVEPVCILRGLGEIESVQRRYAEHAKNAAAL
ncbi:MAG: sirohydrochlorin cobaltochelatase [Oscillospiraceae bacterium]|nr:sirohydrochlorin cobaltochelatase [Oscillospiraceae bacterium]